MFLESFILDDGASPGGPRTFRAGLLYSPSCLLAEKLCVGPTAWRNQCRSRAHVRVGFSRSQSLLPSHHHGSPRFLFSSSPKRKGNHTPHFSACDATGDLPLYFSFPSFSSFLTSVSNRWPNRGGLKPLLIKFQAGWLPWESGWMWWRATWCPPSTAASWEKADFPEGPCDLPADAGGPALADCVTWAQWRAHKEFWGFKVTGGSTGNKASFSQNTLLAIVIFRRMVQQALNENLCMEICIWQSTFNTILTSNGRRIF